MALSRFHILAYDLFNFIVHNPILFYILLSEKRNQIRLFCQQLLQDAYQRRLLVFIRLLCFILFEVRKRSTHTHPQNRFENFINFVIFDRISSIIIPNSNNLYDFFVSIKNFNLLKKLSNFLCFPVLGPVGLGFKEVFKIIIILNRFRNNSFDNIFGRYHPLDQFKVFDGMILSIKKAEE